METFKTRSSKSLPHPTPHADDGNNGNLGENLKMYQTKAMPRGQTSKRRRRRRRKAKALTIAAAQAAAKKAAEVATVPTDPKCPNVTIEAKTSEPRPDGGNTGIIPDDPDAGLKVRRRKASRSRLQPSRLRRIAARAAARAAATSPPKTKEPDPK